jgi:hypothetical protein
MRILIGFDAKDEKENNDRNVVAVFFKVAQGTPNARVRVETRNLQTFWVEAAHRHFLCGPLQASPGGVPHLRMETATGKTLQEVLSDYKKR